jgi:hypothetical protein
MLITLMALGSWGVGYVLGASAVGGRHTLACRGGVRSWFVQIGGT